MTHQSARKRPILVPVVLAIVIAVAGCTNATNPPPDETNESSGTSTPGPCEEPCGTDEPGVREPSWQVGQWWEWTVVSGDTSFSVKTTVDGIEGDVSHHGSTTLEDGLAAVWFHLPPLGQVNTDDLSWVIHDDFNSFLQFPLTDNMTWTGTLEGDEIQLTSQRIESGLYSIEGVYDNGGVAVRVQYDAEAEMYASIELLYGATEPWSSAVLTAFGTGERLSNHVPVYRDLVIGWAATPDRPLVTESFDIATETDYVVVGCSTRGAPGVFGVLLRPPLTEARVCPRTGPVFAEEHNMFDIVILEAVPGEWRYEIMGTAEGFVSTEIFAVSLEGP